MRFADGGDPMQISSAIECTRPLARGRHSERSVARERDSLAASAQIPAGRVIFWQDDAQGQEIEVVKGVVRAVRLLENGSRQILAFFWPGETIRPAPARSQLCTAEAVTSCRLRWSSPHQDALSTRDLSGADQVLREMLPLMLVIGKKTTIPRIAWFLLRIQKHLPSDARRKDAQQIMLPRADIADYLGTSVETVCRTLAEFRAKGLIDLPTRKTIRFVDVPRLTLIAEG
jgi:CRP-like cAMP-binding protein